MDAADAAIKPIIGLTTYLEQADTDGCGRVRAPPPPGWSNT
jgi:putative glutamine amidotransferase